MMLTCRNTMVMKIIDIHDYSKSIYMMRCMSIDKSMQIKKRKLNKLKEKKRMSMKKKFVYS